MNKITSILLFFLICSHTLIGQSKWKYNIGPGQLFKVGEKNYVIYDSIIVAKSVDNRIWENSLIQQHLDKICETYGCKEDSYNEKTNEGILKYYSEQRFVEKWKNNIALILIDDNKLDYFVIPKNYGMIDDVLDLEIEDGIFYNSNIVLFPFDGKIYFLKVKVLKEMLSHTEYDEVSEIIAKLKSIFEDKEVKTIPKAIPDKNRISWQSVVRYASKEYPPIELKRTLKNTEL